MMEVLTTYSQAPYDLDNLRLADIPEGTQVSAHFDLEAIMLTGSCIDVTQGGNRGVSVGREQGVSMGREKVARVTFSFVFVPWDISCLP